MKTSIQKIIAIGLIMVLVCSNAVYAEPLNELSLEDGEDVSHINDIPENNDVVDLSEEPDSGIEEDGYIEAYEESVDEIADDKNCSDSDKDLSDLINDSTNLSPTGTGEEVTDGTYKGTVNKDGTVTITGLTYEADYGLDPKIPATIEGRKVTAIGDGAFSKSDHFWGKLVIPNTVKTIGDYAFSESTRFDGDLAIPDSVVSIGEQAFYCCGFNKKLTLGKNIKNIGNSAFLGCNFTGNLIIPDSVTSVGDKAFAECGFNGRLKIGSSVKEIGSYAFSRQTWNRGGMFKGDLIIPKSVKTIGEYAFCNCDFNGKLKIESNIKEISDGTFSSNCFKGDLIIPDSVVTIGDWAFDNSGFNKKLKIGKKVKSIGKGAFKGGSAIENHSNNFTGDLIIPDSVTTIGAWAFDRSGFTGKLKLSKKIDAIEDYTFFKCNFINDLNIPSGVETIGKQAFYRCGFTGTLTIPKSVTYINELDKSASFDECYWVRKIKNNSNVSLRASRFVTANVDDYFVSNKGKKIKWADHIKKGTYTRNRIKVKKVSLNTARENVFKGDKIKLVATVSPKNATNPKVTWKSSNKKVATVSKSGEVSAKKAGKTTITVTTKEGKKTAKCRITVKNIVRVTSVKLDNTAVIVNKGDGTTLEATVYPKNANNKKVTWSTSDPSIATVSQDGMVSGKKPGTAYITVTTEDGGKTAKCKVVVKDYSYD